jgi:predicted DNA-binding transcriptional regulator AlpA
VLSALAFHAAALHPKLLEDAHMERPKPTPLLQAPDDVLLTTEQVAEFTQTSKSLWDKWRSLNQGPPWVRIGRAARMRRSVLEAWLTQQENPNAA